MCHKNIDLKYSLQTANIEHREYRHQQVVMKEVGIGYERCEPFSIADCWIFYNCSDIPVSIPSFLTAVK